MPSHYETRLVSSETSCTRDCLGMTSVVIIVGQSIPMLSPGTGLGTGPFCIVAMPLPGPLLEDSGICSSISTASPRPAIVRDPCAGQCGLRNTFGIRTSFVTEVGVTEICPVTCPHLQPQPLLSNPFLYTINGLIDCCRWRSS